MSHAEARRLGWERVDPQPWGKLTAHWAHRSGWYLEHCGHPTANTPWALYNPAGEMVRMGVRRDPPNPNLGTAWPDLTSAMAYVMTVVG